LAYATFRTAAILEALRATEGRNAERIA
jgi:hypothetical protein